MEEKTIVFTLSRESETRPHWRLRTKSRHADESDKVIELNAIDVLHYLKVLSRKYNDRNIAVLFDYED